ncbi:MAG: J domain-containing protein, partial [Nodosilinea sp.]
MPDLNSKSKTHYDQLGVKPTASPQQIRRAFRDLSKLYHPDTTALPAAEATEKFQQLNNAYAILSSPDRRWAYDQQVGYSRISVMQPLDSLRHTPTAPSRREPANMYLDPTDRPLSAGEIFALFILGLTFVACLALVVTVSLTRGEYAASLGEPEIDLNKDTSPDAPKL